MYKNSVFQLKIYFFLLIIRESGFLKVDIGNKREFEYVWVEKYDNNQNMNGVNICGSLIPEGKFSAAIDVEFAHIDNDITLAFGSSLQDDPF